MNLNIVDKKLFRYEAKQNKGLFLMGMVTLLVALPMKFIISMGDLRDIEEGTLHTTKENLLNNYVYGNYELYVALGLMALINGLVLFSYLHSKTKTDFYFGLPVEKKELFWGEYLQGIAAVLLPYLLNVFLVFIISIAYNCLSLGFVHMILSAFLANMLFYFAIFALTILAVVLSGKILYSIITIMVLLSYFPAYDFVCNWGLTMFHSQLEQIRVIRYYLSPVTVSGMYFDKIEHKVDDMPDLASNVIHYQWRYLLVWLLMAVVFMILARKLYGRRKAESAGKAIVFPVAKQIIRIALFLFLIILFGIGVPIALFRCYSVYIGFGFIVGIPFAQFLVDSLLNQQWTTFLHGWKKISGYLVFTVLVILFAYWFDWQSRYQGFDNISPDITASQIVKAGGIVCQDVDNIQGKENWDKFVSDTKKGVDSDIRIAYPLSKGFRFSDVYFKYGKFYYFTQENLYDRGVYPYLIETKIQNRYVMEELCVEKKEPERIRHEDDKTIEYLFTMAQ